MFAQPPVVLPRHVGKVAGELYQGAPKFDFFNGSGNYPSSTVS